MFFFPFWNFLPCLPQDAREAVAQRFNVAINGLPPFRWSESVGMSECSICLVDFDESAECRQLGCSHCFHTKCIDRWWEQRLSCPLCNADPLATSCKAVTREPTSPTSVMA